MLSQLYNNFISFPYFFPSYETCNINVNPLFHAAIKNLHIQNLRQLTSSSSFIFLQHLAREQRNQLPSYETCNININPLFHAAIKNLHIQHLRRLTSSAYFIFQQCLAREQRNQHAQEYITTFLRIKYNNIPSLKEYSNKWNINFQPIATLNPFWSHYIYSHYIYSLSQRNNTTYSHTAWKEKIYVFVCGSKFISQVSPASCNTNKNIFSPQNWFFL